MKKAIGIDIGGTKIAIGLVRSDGLVLKKEEIPTHSELSGEYILSEIVQQLSQFDRTQISGIGIGTAGQISPSGQVLSATNTFANWQGINLKERIQQAMELPVAVVNDVQAMGLGEQHFGAGKNVRDFICLAIGTGVGGAIISDGKLIRGAHGAAGEFGHLVLTPNGRPCPCGNQGCLEAHVSGKAIEAIYQESFGIEKKGKDIFLAAQADSQNAMRIVERYIADLATGLISLVNIFNPAKVIVGGGVARSLTPYMQELNKQVQAKVQQVNENVSIELSPLREEAMLVGAASLVW